MKESIILHNFKWYPEFAFEQAVIHTQKPHENRRVNMKGTRYTVHGTSIQKRHNFSMNPSFYSIQCFFSLIVSIPKFESGQRVGVIKLSLSPWVQTARCTDTKCYRGVRNGHTSALQLADVPLSRICQRV